MGYVFSNKNSLNSYVGLAPHTVGSGEHEEIKFGGNRKKKQLHYLLIESSWRAVRFNLEYRARYGAMLAKGACLLRATSETLAFYSRGVASETEIRGVAASHEMK